MNAIASFGRLGNFIDDAENQFGAWMQQHTQQFGQEAADAGYAKVKANFEQDKQQIVDEIIVAAKPGMAKAVNDILNDAQTQSRIGELQSDIESKALKLAVATSVGTAVLTWALVRYAGGK